MGGQCSSASSYLAAKEMQAVASSCHSDRAMSRLLRILSRKSTEAWIVEPPRLNWSPTSDCSIGIGIGIGIGSLCFGVYGSDGEG